MEIKASTPQEYVEKLPDDRKLVINKLREIMKQNLPKGFEEEISYGMIGYVVPYSIYPAGYRCKPKCPLPFINIASQKNHVAVYYMGFNWFPDIAKWFEDEYPKHVSTKLDMGKGCIRFKNINTIPYELLGQLCTKLPLMDYVNKYEEYLLK